MYQDFITPFPFTLNTCTTGWLWAALICFILVACCTCWKRKKFPALCPRANFLCDFLLVVFPTAGLAEVIIYSSPDDRRKNRGFCFLEYDSHKSASLAKRRLSTGRVKIFGCDIIVDWADPQEEPDTDTMSKVGPIYTDSFTYSETRPVLYQVRIQIRTIVM